MSEEQLSALLAKLNEDAGFTEKLQGAEDLDAAVAMAKEAGFDVSKADWLEYQAKQTLVMEGVSELSDEQLEGVTGGGDELTRKMEKHLDSMRSTDAMAEGMRQQALNVPRNL